MQSVSAKHLYPEKYYQNKWCNQNQGRQEVILPDSTRIDCLTKTYATEFDFAPKWAESIGQSLHYARMTGKKPGIVLIIEKPEDFKYYNRIVPLCKQYDITLWYMETPKEAQSPSNEDFLSYFNLENLIAILINFVKDFLATLV